MISGFHLFFGFITLLFLLLSFLGEANNNNNNNINSNAAAAVSAKSSSSSSPSDRVYIVYMGASRVRSTNSAPRSDHAKLLSMLMKRKKKTPVRTYSNGFFGFAARLSHEEAKSISRKPGVVSVFPDRVLKLHTTRSWDFLNSLENKYHQGGSLSNSSPPPPPTAGTDHGSIIGIIDTGIWPESSSFDDKNMGPIPSRWNGTCMKAEDFPSTTCNGKVIGARYYLDDDDDDDEASRINTARDKNGHGTYGASIVAGVPVSGASYYGLANGTARGGAPFARIAVYNVCRANGLCLASAILNAFDDAIADGVDVISIAIGFFPGEVNLEDDAIAIGSFHAVENDITVVCSAGNSGPSPGTIGNPYPWVTTVAATTSDRKFETAIVLSGNNGFVIKGEGINYPGHINSDVYGLVDGRGAASNQQIEADASNCVPGSLDDAKVKGKIVLCKNTDGWDYELGEKFDALKNQSAIGIIVMDNNLRQAPQIYDTPLVVAIVSEEDGGRILSYIHSTSNPLATILATVTPKNKPPAPVVPNFSSRGPAYLIGNLLKPDVAAPGVAILGAWPPQGNGTPEFNIISGTSASCPHVTALVAIINSQHPTWSPSAIRSAIMTTAIQTNNFGVPITRVNGSKATPYDIGAGEINMLGALNPGLVYETATEDYVQFLCNFGYNASVIQTIGSTVPDNFSCPINSSPDLISDMNYPSIAVSGLKAKEMKTVNRTVTNVGEPKSTYVATVEAPAGVRVQVVPKILNFTSNVRKISFQVTFKLTGSPSRDLFGSITLSNHKYNVRSSFVVSKI